MPQLNSAPAPIPASRLNGDWGAPIISILVVLAFAGTILLAALGKLPNNQNVGMLIGAIVTAFAGVVHFWTGDTAGGKAQDTQIAQRFDATQQQLGTAQVALANSTPIFQQPGPHA